MGDHAGHLVYDEGANAFHLGVSTWGDFTYNGVQVDYARVAPEILEGVNVVEARRLRLPSSVSSWDPHFVRIGSNWYVAYVESPSQGNPWKHYPALAKGRDLSNLTLVGREDHLRQTEGMVMQRFGEEWYVLCSSGSGEVTDSHAGPMTYRIYNLNMQFVGKLNAPYVSNIPHPMVTPLARDGNTKWVMFTFDGTMYHEPMLGYGTHGDFYVMDGQPVQAGYEFPPRNP